MYVERAACRSINQQWKKEKKMKKFAWLFTLVLLILLNACGTPAPVTEAPVTGTFRVAVVMPSVVNDSAFSQSMYDALVRIQTEMGGTDKFEIVYTDNMFVVEEAAAAIRDYAAQEYDLVIAHGSQYGTSLQEIAPDFPRTSFAWGTTAETFGQPNIFAYEAASQEGGYVNGVLAATLSVSNIIGVVGPVEVGDAKLYIDGFKAGVLATKPDAQVNVNYIGSFSDVPLASEAAATHLSAGADVLTGSSQMVVGAIDKAKEANALWFGTQSNQSSLAPSIVVSSQVYHWEVALHEMINLIQNGTLGGSTFTADLSNGGEVIEFNPDYVLSAEAKALADATIQGIIDGRIKVALP
jgi:basic membrane lipoprotein Med (substrate-binding protein (PBP1-ABC) superfamily)